ncbi:MAG: hypothetical protein K6A62_05435, partial [Bacteroidales bacterium]|nr:hypothetical protein [Bacteroidales bacterium]
MKDRFRILFTLLLPGALLVSCHPTQRTDAVLRDVESYINECPDSARVVLQSLDTTDLRTRQLRARYALLLTMALDKSYADVPDQVFDPAFRWYTRRGTPDERLKVWYYQGRRMVAHGNQNAAATAYSRAEAYVPEALDQHAVGLLYIAMQHLYSTVVNRTKEQEYAEKAYEVFKRADDPLTAPSLGILAG